jgi:hypothetical protein
LQDSSQTRKPYPGGVQFGGFGDKMYPDIHRDAKTTNWPARDGW